MKISHFVCATLWNELVAKLLNKYGLLTEFEVHTVYYGPIFFTLGFVAQARVYKNEVP